MATKTTKASKKTVKVEVDARAMRNLVEAMETLSQYASAWIEASDDPVLRRKLAHKRGSQRSAA